MTPSERSGSDPEWELAKDRELDTWTDHQLVYTYNAIEVTLGERGWYIDRDRIWHKSEAEGSSSESQL